MRSIRDSFAFRSRGIVGIVLLLPVGIAVIFSDPIVREDTPLDFTFDALAWFLFGLYITFRLWATLYVGGRKDRVLQTEGPYSITRNPLYFGSFCFGLSTAFFFNSFSLVAALAAIGFIYAHLVIKAEEGFLESQFGDAFREYCRRTPRIFPALSGYRSGENFPINLSAMKTEMIRLWGAALVPLSAEIITYFRSSPKWPHWFQLP